jgi:Ca-activated chloride channel family protein
MEAPAGPRGAKLVSVDGRTFPLEAARVAARTSGALAFSTLVQTYRNPYAEPLEVVYTLPLPADGAVIGYTMRLGERVIRGEVRPREEAKAAYEKALFEGRSAALLEQDRDDTFTQRLGSLPAGEPAELTIEVMHPLGFLVAVGKLGPEWEYRFPTVVGPRYTGVEGRVPDADRLSPDRAESPGEIPTRIELTLTTDDATGAAVKRVESMPLDRDLVLRWAAGEPAIGAQLVEGPGLPGDDGRYGVLTITPPRAPATAFARDLTILIDASGSMSGLPIEWAKDVASGLLRSLGEGDRFELIAFSDQPRSLTGGIVPVTDRSLREALGALTQLMAGGGTEMADAVIQALRSLRPESQHQILLITDGEIGFEDEIVSRIVSGLVDGSRLHTVGVGAAPNRTLTSRAARAGRGVESFVCGDGEVQAAVKRLIAATARPVLTDVTIASAVVSGVAPARPKDVFAGQPLVVAVELDPAGGTLEVEGQLAGTTERWAWRLTIPPLAAREGGISTTPIGALYGREVIADLEMNGAGSRDRVLNVAMRHRIASRVTSLVAISEEPAVDPKAPRRRVTLPVEVPAFVSAEAAGIRSIRGGYHRAQVALKVRSMPSGSEDDVAHWLPPEAAMHDRDVEPSKPGWLARFFLGRSKRPESAIRVRVLAVEGNLLVVEYESPSDGFIGLSGDVLVTQHDRPLGSGTIDLGRSSPRGPHAEGLLLRLAVVGDSDFTCRVGDELLIIGGSAA